MIDDIDGAPDTASCVLSIEDLYYAQAKASRGPAPGVKVVILDWGIRRAP